MTKPLVGLNELSLLSLTPRDTTPITAVSGPPASNTTSRPDATGWPSPTTRTRPRPIMAWVTRSLSKAGPARRRPASARRMRIAPALAVPVAGPGEPPRGTRRPRAFVPGRPPGTGARRPHLADAYVRLAYNLKGRLPVTDIEAMEDHARARKYLPDESRSQLLFALAGSSTSEAITPAPLLRLEPANALQASARAGRGQVEDPDVYSRFIDRIIAAFTPELIARGRGWGDPDPRPVFVVGLPRSGTTLIEQILASHPRSPRRG